MIKKIKQLGLDGAAITEHGYLWSESELQALKRAGEAESLFMASGREIESDLGHLLVFGLKKNPEELLKATEIIKEVHNGGGIVVWAHPFRYGRYSDSSDEEFAETARKFDAIEALTPSQSPAENARAMDIVIKFGITALGVSDAHTVRDIGAYVTEFNKNITTMEELTACIKNGECRPRTGAK